MCSFHYWGPGLTLPTPAEGDKIRKSIVEKFLLWQLDVQCSPLLAIMDCESSGALQPH